MPLEGLGLMDFFDNEYDVTDQVKTLATPGHTPGHHVVIVSSQGQHAMIVGDALHSRVQVQEPTWCAGVDIDKADSRRSREDILRRAEADNYLIAAGHFHPDERVGRVILKEGRRYWQAL